MLLQRLKAFADEHMALPPMLYSKATVRYLIDLDLQGRPRTNQLIDLADPTVNDRKRGLVRFVPQIGRTAAPRPFLLVDKAEYMFGLLHPGGTLERAIMRHAAFLTLLDKCFTGTSAASIDAIYYFLTHDPLGLLALPADLDRDALIGVTVDGVWPIDLLAVQDFWAAYNDPTRAAATIMQCLVCGRERPVLQRLQTRLKQFPGGRTTGMVLVSANDRVYESYGLKASLSNPICAECGERFTQALTALLDDPNRWMLLGDAVVVSWTRPAHPFTIQPVLTQPDLPGIRELIGTVQAKSPMAPTEDPAWYGVVLSANNARLVVRDWMETTVGNVQRNLITWFSWQRLVGPRGEEAPPLSLLALAAATVRDPARELLPGTVQELLHACVSGTPVPLRLLHVVVRRIRLERRVSQAQAALLKLVVASHQPLLEEEWMVALDPSNPDLAYLCGRLLAVLAEIQHAAIGQPLLVDRFYGSASTAPASVFGKLVQGSSYHLRTIRRGNPQAYQALQGRVTDILGLLPTFPRTLPPNDQATFALGFYHQRAAEAGRIAEAVARRTSSHATDDLADLPDAEDVILPADSQADDVEGEV